jgi:hypothetical protein
MTNGGRVPLTNPLPPSHRTVETMPLSSYGHFGGVLRAAQLFTGRNGTCWSNCATHIRFDHDACSQRRPIKPTTSQPTEWTATVVSTITELQRKVADASSEETQPRCTPCRRTPSTSHSPIAQGKARIQDNHTRRLHVPQQQ